MSRYSGRYYKGASNDTRKQKRHEAYRRAVEAYGTDNAHGYRRYADPVEFLRAGEGRPS